MNQNLSREVSILKQCLTKLNPTGPDGFEGLMRVFLNEITGAPFRLAASGTQGGRDGRSITDDDIVFEAKLYTTALKKDSVIVKLTELSRDGVFSDMLFVLGSTIEVSDQISTALKKDSERFGISLLILDWLENPIPPLAVALAMAKESVSSFLRTHLDASTADQATNALGKIAADKSIEKMCIDLSDKLNATSMGLSFARKQNEIWIKEALCDIKKSRLRFKQPLAITNSDTNLQDRKGLLTQITPYLVKYTPNEFACIHGVEGAGKSWSVLHSWNNLEEKPLLLFFPPEEISNTNSRQEINELLITKFIEQTGELESHELKIRWQNRIKRWIDSSDVKKPRFIVLLDGINQRFDAPWGDIISGFTSFVSSLGGNIIVTSRTIFFEHQVENHIFQKFKKLQIPEWSVSERDNILSSYGIAPDKVNQNVLKSLLNPRLLSIALEVISKEKIEEFKELNVSRILFEYLNNGNDGQVTISSNKELEAKIRESAAEVLKRLSSNHFDDLTLFNQEAIAISEGLLFLPVQGEPDLYELNEDGLNFALAIMLIREARKALRNDKNVTAYLLAFLEPISALDHTVKIVLAALTINSTDHSLDASKINNGLLSAFLELQNPDEQDFYNFSAIARRLTEDYFEVARVALISDQHYPNLDWIKEALLNIQVHSESWKHIDAGIRKCLKTYCLKPEISVYEKPKNQGSEYEGKVEERKLEIEKKLSSFSSNEKKLMKKMKETEYDYSRISKFCFNLLAGKALSSFSEELVCWSLSVSLNSSITSPEEDFSWLLSFNKIDWLNTRDHLIFESNLLRERSTSSTGQWALVRILRSTGDAADAASASKLYEILIKDRPNFANWRLVEQYCSVDPCDPSSIKPENVVATAKKFTRVDVNTIHQSIGATSEDHFFDGATPSMVRFYPELAIKKYEELVGNIVNRKGPRLRHGLFQSISHTCLLTEECIALSRARLTQTRRDKSELGVEDTDFWILVQYFLLVIIPHLNPNEQLKSLLEISELGQGILLKLYKAMDHASSNLINKLLREAIANEDEIRIFILVYAASHTSVVLDADLIEYIFELINSKNENLRISSLEFISSRENKEGLRILADSSWSYNEHKNNKYESWHASKGLVAAYNEKIIEIEDLFLRISPEYYGIACKNLTNEDMSFARQLIRQSINSLAVSSFEHDVLNGVTLETDYNARSNGPGLFSFENIPKQSPSKLDKLFNNELDYQKEQEIAREKLNALKKDLIDINSELLICNVEPKDFKNIISSDLDFSIAIAKDLLELEEKKRSSIHNIALMLAYSLAENSPKISERLFELTSNNNPLIEINYFMSSFSLKSLVIWECPDLPFVNKLRLERFLEMSCDEQIASEVIAALSSGKLDIIKSIIADLVKSPQPTRVALGITISGFSSKDSVIKSVIDRYKDYNGLIGKAYGAAVYAYERNLWAMHWYEKMCSSQSKTEFWPALVLLSKVVDSRFVLWRANYPNKEGLEKRFWVSFSDKLNNRIKKWRNKRKKTLYGGKVPTQLYTS